jgi:hypothetical protein
LLWQDWLQMPCQWDEIAKLAGLFMSEAMGK